MLLMKEILVAVHMQLLCFSCCRLAAEEQVLSRIRSPSVWLAGRHGRCCTFWSRFPAVANIVAALQSVLVVWLGL